MARKRPHILSADELAAIRERKAAGQAPVSPIQEVQLRNRIEDLEVALEEANAKLQNRATLPAELRKSLDALLEAYDVEPAEELIKLALKRKPGIEPGTEGEFVLSNTERKFIWETLLQYRMPKLKSVENSGTVKHEHTIKVVMLTPEGNEKIIETKTMTIAND